MDSDSSQSINSLASGVRSVALVFILILSYFNIRLAFQIGNFHAIFEDMLGGKPLPAITELVIQSRLICILLALAIPVAAIAVVALVRSHKAALYFLSGLMVVIFIQIHLTWSGLFAPLMTIISGMRGA